jgi:probable rRNA maturation factor
MPMSKPNKPTVKLALAVQYGVSAPLLPRWRIRRWVQRSLIAALRDQAFIFSTFAVVVRIEGTADARALNAQYRDKDYATNVLTFEYGLAPDGSASADIVLCLPIIKQEARTQRKDFLCHAAHLTVHGTLHALGYDHLRVRDAKKMEALEIEILAEMGISDPYYLA